MVTYLRRFLVTALILILLLVAVSGVLLYAPQGPRWLAQLIDELTPGELVIEELRGRLTGPLNIRKLRYSDGELKVGISQLQLEWRPWSLLSGKIRVQLLDAEGFKLDLPQPSEDETAPFTGVDLPLRIELEQARVKNIRITPAGSEAILIDEIELRANAAEEQLMIEAAAISAYDARLQLQGTLKLVQALPLNLQLDWDYNLPEGGTQQGAGALRGDLSRLQISQRLEGLLQGGIEAELFDLEENPHWDAVLKIGHLQTAAFLPEQPMSIDGELKSVGRTADFSLQGNLRIEGPQSGLVEADLLLKADGSRIRAEKLHLTMAEGGTFDATGYWSIAHEPEQRFQAEIEWSKLRWPLTGAEQPIRSEQGSLRLEGDPADYNYDLALDLIVPQAPALTLQSVGRGDRAGLSLDSLTLRLLDGVVKGSGGLNWEKGISGSLALEGSDLDPGKQYPEWPGKVGFKISSQAIVEQNRITAKADLEQLQGTLRGFPLQGSGGAELTEKGLKFSSLKLASGGANVTASGSIGKRMALTWSIEANDLAKAFPGAQGVLSLTGSLSGTAQRPRLQAALSAANLRYQTARIDRLEGVIDLEPNENHQQKLDIQAQGLVWDELRWQQLKLTGEGTQADHQLDLKLIGKGAPEAGIGIAAGLSPAMVWQGAVRTLRFEHPSSGGAWKLQEPQPFLVGSNSIKLDPGCLNSGKASLCYRLAGDEGGAWQGSLSGEQLPLSLLSPWLPEQFDLGGRAGVNIALRRDAANIITGELKLALTECKAIIAQQDEQHAFDLSKAALSAQLNTQGVDADLRIPVEGVGYIKGELHLPGLNPLQLEMERQPLAGEIQATLSDLTFLSGLFPALQAIAGRVDADFALTGTLASPQIAGRGELSGAGFEVPALGIKISEMSLDARSSKGRQIDYTGAMESGGGRLTLRGTTDIDPAGGWPTELELKGKDWLVVDLPEAWLLASPDLTLKLRDGRTRLRGDIRIPRARLKPKSVPEIAVTNSSDLVLSDDSKGEEEHTENNALYLQVRLMLGDQVSFDGFGLRGRFAGNLMIIDEPGRPVLGNGLLRIKDGIYQAYGQDLQIERGLALFAATPIDNPGLDIQAVRKVEGISAGLRVAGTLKKPRLDLFSTPALPESEILSYLLLGRPSDAKSTLTKESTAALLAASGVEQVTKELGRQIGLEELRLETSGTLESAAIVAGTYLSPRLYVQYVNEINARENRLRLRYDVNEKIQIQTETGKSQGVDLFYTIER